MVSLFLFYESFESLNSTARIGDAPGSTYLRQKEGGVRCWDKALCIYPSRFPALLSMTLLHGLSEVLLIVVSGFYQTP